MNKNSRGGGGGGRGGGGKWGRKTTREEGVMAFVDL